MKRITKREELPRLDSDTFKLEEAYEAARDARDIIRDKQRREQRSLPEYTGEDEDTARHEVHVHVHQPSQPDREDEPQLELGPMRVRGIPRWLVVTLAAIVAAGTALLARLSSR